MTDLIERLEKAGAAVLAVALLLGGCERTRIVVLDEKTRCAWTISRDAPEWEAVRHPDGRHVGCDALIGQDEPLKAKEAGQ